MAVFYNSSAQIQTASVTNLTMSSLSVTATMSGTVQAALTGQIVITANATSNTDLQSRLILTNSNSITFGAQLVANSVVVTASTRGAIVVSASNTSAVLSTLVFTSTNNFSFGISTAAGSTGQGTIFASYTGAQTDSYYNYPSGPFLGSTFTNLIGTLSTTGRTNIVQPFNLPYAVSFNNIRLPGSLSIASTSAFASTVGGAAANPAFFAQTINLYANIYTLGTGTQSSALILANSFSFASAMRWSYSWAASNNNTYGFDITFGRDNTTTFTTYGYSALSANIVFQTSQLTNWTGNKFIDVIVTNGASLSQGPYWLAVQVSVSTTQSIFGITTGPMSNGIITFSNFINTQYASGFGLMNAASTHLKLGGGFWTGTAIGGTSATLALSNITTNASNVEVPFEMMNWV